jgi:cellulose synthase/poly-beta-1,6-N-acetylglucosamine synthase-like glycosyltransferase
MARPEFLRRCLEHLDRQTITPAQVIVVDSSADDLTRKVVAGFSRVDYLRNPLGPGHTAESRNLAYQQSRADVLAFLDDDAYADPCWLERLLEPYADPTVGGVGGRARRGTAREGSDGVEEIGRFRADGTLTGNFGADPGQVIEVDHLLGANMSYRRAALDQLGRIFGGYPGTCLREETDTALRLASRGWRLLYTPHAVVDHVAGPTVSGRRFDIRYDYYGHRNHVVLLIRNCGIASSQLRGYLRVARRQALLQLRRGGGPGGLRERTRSAVAGAARAGAILAGVGVGIVAGLRGRRADARVLSPR